MSTSGTPDFLPHTYVPTVNQLGYCLGKLNYLSEAFLNFSKQHPGRTLDLGCGFGFHAYLAAAHNPVYAIDTSQEHLRVMMEKAPTDIQKKSHHFVVFSLKTHFLKFKKLLSQQRLFLFFSYSWMAQKFAKASSNCISGLNPEGGSSF